MAPLTWRGGSSSERGSICRDIHGRADGGVLVGVKSTSSRVMDVSWLLTPFSVGRAVAVAAASAHRLHGAGACPPPLTAAQRMQAG